jgi:predicted deacylase
LVVASAAALLGFSSLGVAAPTATRRSARILLGRSVDARPIYAYVVGDRRSTQHELVVGCIHGDETAGVAIARRLERASPTGVELWIVPLLNPDGAAAGTRGNAHGVDLNRNFPFHWAALKGGYYSGPGPASEPETRAMMRFLRAIKPVRIVSFHQPLHGVDTDTKSQRLSRRLSRYLELPRRNFSCGGVCHGTMTGWYNKHFHGAAITVEYGEHPSRHRMRVDAPRQLLRMFGARRVG